VQSAEKPTARISPFTASEPPTAAMASEPPEVGDRKSKELGKFLLDYRLTHYAPALMPRGLSNRSNWCFVNAILQALLACPPFYNLFKSIPLVPGLKSGKPVSPMLECLIDFIHEFNPLETISKPQKREKGRKKEEIRIGGSLEPSYVYKMLLNLSSDTFKVIEGRQEDAEEFLTCLLNGTSDEMLALIKQVVQEKEVGTEEENEDEGEGDDWKEVDSRGKSCITRRIASDTTAPVTPIQAMGLGMCRSSVKSGGGESSATLQPFFTLQLDIQSSDITSIHQALVKNFDSEDIDGYICQKTKKVVEASRSLSLEELPPILILHMKRFVYDGSTGGVQKVMKPVDFSVDLEIPKSVLSAEARPKYNTKQRQYKLFAVVYHTGREATKGHYVTDVYHTGYGTWMHCDDSAISETAEQSVVTPAQTSTPYILFYRRCDTMVGLDKTAEKK
jgi:ubiquitin carboxyl-terminal hydrolase 10